MRSILKIRRRHGGPFAAGILESDSDSARERLLHAARNAGLESGTVVNVAEALTRRPWACIDSTEIATVARALLSAANRVAFQPSAGGRPCAS
jgi:hypothetical protein